MTTPRTVQTTIASSTDTRATAPVVSADGILSQQVAACKHGHVKGHIGANHDDVAVGEVQHLGNAVDHGVAQGDDGVDAAQADAR